MPTPRQWTRTRRSNVVGFADRDGDGHYEEVMRDLDGDGRPDRFDYDRDGDSVADEVAYDGNGDGEPDLLLDEFPRLAEVQPGITQSTVEPPADDHFGAGLAEASDPDLEAREADAFRDAFADSVRLADPDGPPDVLAAPTPEPEPFLPDLADASDVDDALAYSDDDPDD